MIIFIKLANSLEIQGEKKPDGQAGCTQGDGVQKEYLKPRENTFALF